MDETTQPLSLNERVWWALAYASLLYFGYNYLAEDSSTRLALFGFGVVVLSLVAIGTSLAVSHHRAGLVHLVIISLATLAGTLASVGNAVTTDEGSLATAAARLLAHGHNPYGVNLATHAALSHTPPQLMTYLLNGTHVTTFTYPAGVLWPLALITFATVTHATIVLNTLAWTLAGLVLYAYLPRPMKPLSAVLLLTPMFLYTFTGNDLSSVMIAPLIVAFGELPHFVAGTGSRWRRLLGPLALGVAIAIKPIPVIFLPFIVAAILIESPGAVRDRMRHATHYTLLTVASFMALNLPFVVANPVSWFRGMAQDMTTRMAPSGVGVAGLFSAGLVHRINYSYVSLSSFVFLGVVLAAVVGWYPHLRRAWPALAPLFFIFESRSFWSYFMAGLGAALVYALTLPAPPEARPTPYRIARLSRLAVVVGSGVVALALAGSLTATTISVAVDGGTASPSGYLSGVRITLDNYSEAPTTVVVRAVAMAGGIANAPWYVDATTGRDTITIPARTRLSVALRATTLLVPVHSAWRVEVASPNQIVSSATY